MARTKQEIKTQMTQSFVTNPDIVALYGIDPALSFESQFSNVSLENLLFDIVAYAIWLLEKLFDVFRLDVENRIAETRVHTREWYRNIALYFQLGDELNWIDDKFQYPEIDEDAKIIKHASVQKYLINGYGALRTKVAKEVNNERVPLDPIELTAFQDYMNDVADAGTIVIATSGLPDDLKLKMTISYNPQVLSNDGKRIDGTDDTPLINAINDYLNSQEFNGVLVLQQLQNHLEGVEGVTIVHTTNFEGWSKYGLHNYNTEGNPFAGKINEIRQADAGYFKLDVPNTQITYIASDE